MATTTDVLQSALEAEAKGVPVNWRDLAFKINNAAMEQATKGAEESSARIAKLEAKVAEQSRANERLTEELGELLLAGGDRVPQLRTVFGVPLDEVARLIAESQGGEG